MADDVVSSRRYNTTEPTTSSKPSNCGQAMEPSLSLMNTTMDIEMHVIIQNEDIMGSSIPMMIASLDEPALTHDNSCYIDEGKHEHDVTSNDITCRRTAKINISDSCQEAIVVRLPTDKISTHDTAIVEEGTDSCPPQCGVSTAQHRRNDVSMLSTDGEDTVMVLRRGEGDIDTISGSKYRKRRKKYDQSRRPDISIVYTSDNDSISSSCALQGYGERRLIQNSNACVGDVRHYRRERFTSLSCRSIMSVVWHRTALLVALLLLQSVSQFILETYERLISQHIIVPLFLTMLVGAGGNAGNQAAVRAITGLMVKEFHQRDFLKVFRKEMIVGVINASILATIAFVRVYYFYGHNNLFYSIMAITLSLFCTVVCSVALGCIMPFAIGYFGHDREHAAPIIQVLMDICGVLITCVICSNMIPDSEQKIPNGVRKGPASNWTDVTIFPPSK